MSVEDRITSARAQLLLNKGQGFWGILALRLDMVPTLSVKTLAVDGKRIFYNEEFVGTLSDSLLRSALAHEVMHCVFDHMSRIGSREGRRWNRAGDYVINSTLNEAGFEIGDGWLLDSRFDGMSTDEIYDLLPDDDDDGDGDGDGDPLDEVLPGDPTTSEADRVSWMLGAIQATKATKDAGNLPDSLRRFIDEMTQNTVDWREQLRQFVTQISRDDYSWSRPNRRYLAAGLYLPGLHSETMGEVVVGIDTSGSISQEMLNTFGAEVKAIVAMARPSKLTVIYCDAVVNHVDEFGPSDDIAFAMHGGGGTDLREIFKHIDSAGESPACAIILTDGYTPFPAEPSYPVIWGMTEDIVAPFGSNVKVKT